MFITSCTNTVELGKLELLTLILSCPSPTVFFNWVLENC